MKLQKFFSLSFRRCRVWSRYHIIILIVSMGNEDSKEAWRHVKCVIETCETLSGGPKTYQLTWLKIYYSKTLRSQNCSIWSSSILNKMTSKFANYLTLVYSRITLRHHWVTFWVCRVIYKSRAIERTSNHTLTSLVAEHWPDHPQMDLGVAFRFKKKASFKAILYF